VTSTIAFELNNVIVVTHVQLLHMRLFDLFCLLFCHIMEISLYVVLIQLIMNVCLPIFERLNEQSKIKLITSNDTQHIYKYLPKVAVCIVLTPSTKFL
jgi:hypothetical protein